MEISVTLELSIGLTQLWIPQFSRTVCSVSSDTVKCLPNEVSYKIMDDNLLELNSKMT